MKTLLATIFALCTSALAFDIVTADNVLYSDVSRAEAQGEELAVTHSGGIARIPLLKLRPIDQARFFRAEIIQTAKDRVVAVAKKKEADAAAAKAREEEARDAERAAKEKEIADARLAATLAADREAADRAAKSRADLEKFRAGEAERAEKQRLAQAKADAEAAEKNAEALRRRAFQIGLGILCFLPTLIAMLRARTGFVAIVVLNIMPAVLLAAWFYGMASSPLMAVAGLFAWQIIAAMMAACWLVSLVWSLLPDSAKAMRRAA